VSKILVVDDDDIFRGAVEKNLKAAGHEVVSAQNGKVALEQMAAHKPALIISDVRMPEMDGLELLKRVRSASQIPFILITGFSEIMETQTAHNLGADDFLPKPFYGEDLNRAVSRCLAPASKSFEPDSEFCKLAIDDFITGRTIKFNIFVRLSEAKFIKLAHKGEDISMDRIKYYRGKGLTHLYLRREDFRQYVGFTVSLNQAARRNHIISPEKKLGLLRYTGEILSEQIQHDGIDIQAYDSAQAFVGATLDILTDNPKAVDVLEALRHHADHVLVHSVGVSLYSVMIAQAMQWHLPANRAKVALGGLFHDIGLKEISRALLDRPRYTWNHTEVKTYETHTARGVHILADIEELSEDVREVVKQHHENCLSRGFPAGLKKSAIHPMAKLISVADEFCYRIVKGPEYQDMTALEALQDIRANCAEQLDKSFLEALMQLFRPKAQNSVQAG
jgi:putative nucleotidyltransferase with HDIG domain